MAKINMTALRIVILIAFLLSVAVTVWSMLSTSGGMAHDSMAMDSMPDGGMAHNSILHIAHVVLITLTFLLIALYLYKSAEIASLTIFRELRLRMTVDQSAGFVEFLPHGSPVLNACVGALAKYGVYVSGAASMESLARQKTVAAKGNSASREGYAITKSTLAEMGVELSDRADDCPVNIILGQFDKDDGSSPDFVLVCDKVTHVLTAVYVSRLFVKHRLISRILLILALVCAAVLCVFRQFTYAGTALSLWAALLVISVRSLERKTARLSFKAIAGH